MSDVWACILCVLQRCTTNVVNCSRFVTCFRLVQYREEDAVPYPANIMFDKRVVRGNTYAARILPADVSLTDKKSTGTG